MNKHFANLHLIPSVSTFVHFKADWKRSWFKIQKECQWKKVLLLTQWFIHMKLRQTGSHGFRLYLTGDRPVCLTIWYDLLTKKERVLFLRIWLPSIFSWIIFQHEILTHTTGCKDISGTTRGSVFLPFTIWLVLMDNCNIFRNFSKFVFESFVIFMWKTIRSVCNKSYKMLFPTNLAIYILSNNHTFQIEI